MNANIGEFELDDKASRWLPDSGGKTNGGPSWIVTEIDSVGFDPAISNLSSSKSFPGSADCVESADTAGTVPNNY